MKSGFFFDEYEKWVKDLGIAEKEFENFLKSFLLEQAQRVVALAKDRTPVDTGALKAAYQIGGQEIAFKTITGEDGKEHIPIDKNTGKEIFEIDENKSQIADISLVGDNLEVIIWNPMEYASYVEYGHDQEVGRFVPAIGKRLVKPHVEGYHMLTIAVDLVNQAMPTRFKRQFLQFLKSKGVGD